MDRTVRVENTLRAWRQATNTPLPFLQELCRVDASSLRRWERGWPCPHEQMTRLARHYGLPVHALFLLDAIPTRWSDQ